MTWWIWMLIGTAVAAAQLVATMAVCRAAAIEDERIVRERQRRLDPYERTNPYR